MTVFIVLVENYTGSDVDSVWSSYYLAKKRLEEIVKESSINTGVRIIQKTISS